MDAKLQELLKAALSNPNFIFTTNKDITESLKAIKEFYRTCKENRTGAIIEPASNEIPDYDPYPK